MADKDENAPDIEAVDSWLDELRANPPQPSAELLARVMGDAETVAADRLSAVAASAPNRPGLWASLVAGLGGWPAFAGLATATVAGVWIGYASPDGIVGVGATAVSGEAFYDIGDLMPTLDVLNDEG